LLTNIDGVTFSECIKNKKDVMISGLSISFIGYEDLVKNKKSTGRHRDLDDLENMKE
jgi:predicted nucleotidyltransferase